MNTLREGDQVVVAFDGGSLSAGFASTRFNDVRIDSALSHKLHGLAVFCDILCNGEELFPELGTDNLALCFRVGNAVKQLGIAFFGMNMNEIHIELLGKYLFNLFRLVLAKQAMVYEYAYQLLANCLSAQGCNNGRINAAGKAQNNALVANLSADSGNGVFDDGIHSPVGFQSCDIEQEVGKHLVAKLGVLNFRVELCGVDVALSAFHSRNGANVSGSGNGESCRNLSYGIAVAHPNRLFGRGIFEQRTASYMEASCSVLTLFGVAHGAA